MGGDIFGTSRDWQIMGYTMLLIILAICAGLFYGGYRS